MSIANLAGVKVEIGFGVDAIGGDFFVLDDPVKGELNNVTYLLAPDTVFVDVTEHVAAVSTGRGREHELDEYRTGHARVVFNDDDRTFDPAYSGSPYAGEIVPMKRIAISHNGTALFTGWIDDWSVDYEPGDTLSRVTAECVDGFAIVANQELGEITAAFAGDLSGERVTRVLDRADVDFPATRSIDDGITTLGATTLGGNVLAYLNACARAEGGYLYVAADGTLTFRSRHATLNDPSEVTFSDDRTAGIPYRNVSQRSSAALLYTRVTGESESTGTALTADDAAAQADFLIRTLALGQLLIGGDAETQALLDHLLERFSSPDLRFQTATINVAALTAGEVAELVALDLTDVVTVERSPLGVGATISRVCLVDGIAHRIGHGSWVAELSFANADTRAFFTLDDVILGELDDVNVLAF